MCVQISASETFAKKILLRFFVTTSVTLTNYALVSSGNPVRTHTGEFTMAAAGIILMITQCSLVILSKHTVKLVNTLVVNLN